MAPKTRSQGIEKRLKKIARTPSSPTKNAAVKRTAKNATVVTRSAKLASKRKRSLERERAKRQRALEIEKARKARERSKDAARKQRERAAKEAKRERERAKKIAKREREAKARKAAAERRVAQKLLQKRRADDLKRRAKEREAKQAARKLAAAAAAKEREAARIARAVAKAAAKEAAKILCDGCGGSVSEATKTTCPTCPRRYHPACFVPKQFGGSTAQRQTGCCILCRCGPYAAAPRSIGPGAAVARAFLRDGVAVAKLPGGAVTATTLADARARIDSRYRALRLAYDVSLNSGATVPTLATGYTNFRERGAGRFEIIAPEITEPVFAALVSSGPIRDLIGRLLPPLSSRLGLRAGSAEAAAVDDVVVHSAGCIYATPGASGQNWHTDGPLASLRDDDAMPYAINVFVPLVDVNSSNGTQFVPGTHRPSAIDKRADKTHNATGDAIAVDAPADVLARTVSKLVPSASVGEAVLFDYRVVHRGMPNNTSAFRPLLYTTFTRRWYAGDENFSTTRYKGTLEPLSPKRPVRRRGATE